MGHLAEVSTSFSCLHYPVMLLTHPVPSPSSAQLAINITLSILVNYLAVMENSDSRLLW